MSGLTPGHELLRIRLVRFTRELPGVAQANERAIHRTRVASRRLREVLPVLQLDRELVLKLNRRMRKLTRRLGAVRELDVLLLLIDELAESHRHPDRALRLVKAEVLRDRVVAGDVLDEQCVAGRLRRIARKLNRILIGLESADEHAAQVRSLNRAIEARIAQRAASLKSAIDAAGSVYLAERLHAVRIALKKLRYGVELAVDAASERGAELAALKRTQALLGRMHDLQVLIDRTRTVQGSLKPPSVLVWRELDGLVTSLENSCRRLHARYMRERETLIGLCHRLRGRTPVVRSGSARRAG
jgi:CHAD domain-containing protein